MVKNLDSEVDRRSQSLVDSDLIQYASLHIGKPREFHIYAAPFVVPYSIWIYLRVFKYEQVFGESSEFASLMFILIAAVHALSFLVCQWSVKINAFFTLEKATSPFKAEYIVVIPTANNGSSAICDLKRANEESKHSVYFIFQKQKFIYNSELEKFEPLTYPCDQPTIASTLLERSLKGVALSKSNTLKEVTEKYGPNKFDIPIPKFVELFKEHLVAPFFVFQLFCVALWFLDDMWYYSLFTLAMLLVFESTVVFQRLKNLQEFRTMSIKPYPINVFRDGEWSLVSSETVCPGDIISIVRQKDESPACCDALLLHGTCIANEAMLSGESTPQLKESLETFEPTDTVSYSKDKNLIVYGGTRVLQVTPPTNDTVDKSLVPPDGGALAYALKTGFATQQGKLVRTIIYSTERVSANNLESLLFILFLLFFALIAAWYVWTESLKNEERKRSKVLLDCILIITAVVPPELPMELSLAVNNSLVALSKTYVYCTEPFRIPFAGNIDVACFDKTGTLTEENLIVEGITGLPGGKAEALHSPINIPENVTLVLASSHALVSLDNEIIGDPMEKNTLESIGWEMDRNEVIQPKREVSARGFGATKIRIKKRYQFSSDLKRMSTICGVTKPNGGAETLIVSTKGAPEVIKSMLIDAPSHYDDTYKLWARKGKRVLALGYKQLSIKQDNVHEYLRDSAESGLKFAGFLVFGCPLKPDAIRAVDMLNCSDHRVVMITGDNALTACHVANEVKIVENQCLIADCWENGNFEWRSIDENVVIPLDLERPSLGKQLTKYDLCCTGKAWEKIKLAKSFKSLLPRLWVYARVAPHQKEEILLSLKEMGFITLMAGDGTNDVGALKQAHVGVALLSSKKEEIEKYEIKQKAVRQRRILEQQADLRKKWNLGPLPAQQQKLLDEARKAAPLPSDKFVKNDKGEDVYTVISSGDQEQKTNDGKPLNPMAEIGNAFSMMGDVEDDVPKIKFGDASVAAPFTSKITEVSNVCAIVRQGRATLVAMVQMYKILALNCLISAYSLSVQYLAGIKQGDWQSTIGGLMVTVCFFGIAKATALESLSKKRPQPNVFNAYVIISVLGQAAVHVAALIFVRWEALKWSEDIQEDINLDAEFEPNLLNSGVYLVSLVMQIATFAINYQGLPFRESIFQNKALYNSILVVGSIAVLAASEYSEGLNEWLQLVPFPDSFRTKLLALMAFDFAGAWTVEQICNFFFSNNKPKSVLFPRA